MSEKLVEVKNLRKTFEGRGGDDSHLAVNDVSFTISEGESVALVGESGSGKTTTARCLVGLETPDSGLIEVCGEQRVVRRPNAATRRRWALQTQMVFQDPYGSLDPRQTIDQGLAQLIRFHHGELSSEQRRARIAELLDLVQLSERQGGSRPRALSGGQRQRAAIARALAASPRILVMDEAVAALDVSVQAQILNVLAGIQAETRVSFLFLTHDLAVVRQIADSVLVMKGGEVVERGSTNSVLTNPETEYARLLIESVPTSGWNPENVSKKRKDSVQ